MKNKIGFFTKPYPWVRDYYALIDASVAHGLSVVEGFNDCEFMLPDLEAAKRIRDYAEEKGVSFCCFSCFADLTGSRAAESVQNMKQYAQVAQILGAPYLHHTVIPEHDVPERVLPEREALLRQGIDGVREIFDYAAEHDVLAVYEDQGYILNGVQGFGEFLDRLDRPVGVVADFGNICQVCESIVDFVKAYGDRVVHAHLKDIRLLPVTDPLQPLKTTDGQRFELAPFGQGSVRFQEAIDLLKQMNYSGCYALEFSAKADDSPLIREAIAQITNWIQ